MAYTASDGSLWVVCATTASHELALSAGISSWYRDHRAAGNDGGGVHSARFALLLDSR